jgi:hypothetical protein
MARQNVVFRHEEFQLYLDAFPMLVALVMLNVVHPGQVLKGPGSNFHPPKSSGGMADQWHLRHSDSHQHTGVDNRLPIDSRRPEPVCRSFQGCFTDKGRNRAAP